MNIIVSIYCNFLLIMTVQTYPDYRIVTQEEVNFYEKYIGPRSDNKIQDPSSQLVSAEAEGPTEPNLNFENEQVNVISDKNEQSPL